MCKHLISMLSNKRWLQQVTSTLMDWLEENIDDVNAYLNLSGDKALTLPNELARQNAKNRWQKQNDEKEDIPEQDNKEEPQEENPSNVQGNNPSTNRLNNINDEEVTDNNEQ